MSNDKPHLYGADWCPKSANLRNHMQRIWVEFDDFNVETDPDAEARVRDLYDGKLKFPTVTYKSEHLKNPTIDQLEDFLKKHGLDV